MARKEIGTQWDRDNRNAMNDNFKQLFDGFIDAGHDATEAIQKATEALDKSNQALDKSDSTQKQLNDIIIESGTSDAEVIQARGNHDVLGDRLNSIDQDLAQIATSITFRGASLDDVIGIVNRSAIQTLLNNGVKNIYIPDGTFLIDNSTSPLISEHNDVSFTGSGILKATDESKDLLVMRGKNPSFHAGLEGNGVIDENIQTEEKPALLKVDGRNLSERMNLNVSGAKFINPSTVGLQTFNVVGFKILDNDFISKDSKDNLSTPWTMHILITGSAVGVVDDNLIDGLSQGICGSGLSTSLAFDDYTGLVSNDTRKILVGNNVTTNQWDHGVYFSDYCSDYIISTNKCHSRNEGIKVVGDLVKVINNTSDNGINGRNVKNIEIIGNDVDVFRSGENIYGIYLGDTVFKNHAENIKIKDNRLTHQGTESRAGIMVQGLVWDNFQALIKGLEVKDNTVIGFGGVTNGAGVILTQQFIGENPLNVLTSENLQLAGNIIQVDSGDGTIANYGIVLNGGGFEGVILESNTITGFNSQGVRLLGVRGLVTNNNQIKANPNTTLTTHGIYERNDDETLHINSENNSYGNDVFENVGIEVLWANDSSGSNKKRTIQYTGSNNNTLRSYSNVDKVLVNGTGNKVITIGNLDYAPFTKDSSFEIYNLSSLDVDVQVNVSGGTITNTESDIILKQNESAIVFVLGEGNFAVFKNNIQTSA